MEKQVLHNCPNCKKTLPYGRITPIKYCDRCGQVLECGDENLHNIPASKEETCEYILELDDFNTWKCSKCGLLWHLAADTPIENEMYYCPKCGRKIIQEVTQN